MSFVDLFGSLFGVGSLQAICLTAVYPRDFGGCPDLELVHSSLPPKKGAKKAADWCPLSPFVVPKRETPRTKPSGVEMLVARSVQILSKLNRATPQSSASAKLVAAMGASSGRKTTWGFDQVRCGKHDKKAR